MTRRVKIWDAVWEIVPVRLSKRLLLVVARWEAPCTVADSWSDAMPMSSLGIESDCILKTSGSLIRRARTKRWEGTQACCTALSASPDEGAGACLHAMRVNLKLLSCCQCGSVEQTLFGWL